MKDDILIDNYLKGLLSKEETDAFNERLKVDADFNEKFKLEQQLFNTLNEDSWSYQQSLTEEVKEYKKLLEQDDLQDLKATLTETNSEFNLNSYSTNSKRIYYYLAAASIVIFLGFQFFFNQNLSNEELYDNYVGLDKLPSLVSRSNEETKLSEAQELFEVKKYAEALAIFQSLYSEVENKGNILIYKGLSLTEIGEYKEAEEAFNSLINSNLLDAEKGYWYKALLYLKQDRVNYSKQTLNTIISGNLYNKNKAEELLKVLD